MREFDSKYFKTLLSKIQLLLLLLLFWNVFSPIIIWMRSSLKSRSQEEIKAIYPSTLRMMCALLLLLLLSSSSSSFRCLCLSLAFSSRYFSWTKGNPHRSGLSFRLQYFPYYVWCSKFDHSCFFCSESIEYFPGLASKFFLKPCVTVPVVPVIAGIIIHFIFQIWSLLLLLLYIFIFITCYWPSSCWSSTLISKYLLLLLLLLFWLPSVSSSSGEYTFFRGKKETCQNSRRHSSDMLQVPYWGPTNIWHYRPKCIRFGRTGARDLCTPDFSNSSRRIVAVFTDL